MSSLYGNEGKDDLLPKRKLFCTRCNVDILKPKKVWNPITKKEENEDRAYTYYFSELVCLDCYHKIKKSNKP